MWVMLRLCEGLDQVMCRQRRTLSYGHSLPVAVDHTGLQVCRFECEPSNKGLCVSTVGLQLVALFRKVGAPCDLGPSGVGRSLRGMGLEG